MLRKLSIVFTALVAVLICGAVAAQQPVITYQYPGASALGNGTIAVTNTFQSVFSTSLLRKGCLIQNLGSHTMFVFFGAIGGASSSAAFSLPSSAAAPFSCNSGGTVLTDQISVTGTAGDIFSAIQQ